MSSSVVSSFIRFRLCVLCIASSLLFNLYNIIFNSLCLFCVFVVYSFLFYFYQFIIIFSKHGIYQQYVIRQQYQRNLNLLLERLLDLLVIQDYHLYKIVIYSFQHHVDQHHQLHQQHQHQQHEQQHDVVQPIYIYINLYVYINS